MHAWRIIMATGIAAAFMAAIAAETEPTWTRSQLLAITDEEARKQGYDIEHMSVSFDAFNSEWQTYKTRRTQVGLGAGLPAGIELKDGEYWAVYYAPMRPLRGGDLWVFVDRKSGQILASLQGE